MRAVVEYGTVGFRMIPTYIMGPLVTGLRPVAAAAWPSMLALNHLWYTFLGVVVATHLINWQWTYVVLSVAAGIFDAICMFMMANILTPLGHSWLCEWIQFVLVLYRTAWGLHVLGRVLLRVIRVLTYPFRGGKQGSGSGSQQTQTSAALVPASPPPPPTTTTTTISTRPVDKEEDEEEDDGYDKMHRTLLEAFIRKNEEVELIHQRHAAEVRLLYERHDRHCAEIQSMHDRHVSTLQRHMNFIIQTSRASGRSPRTVNNNQEGGGSSSGIDENEM